MAQFTSSSSVNVETVGTTSQSTSSADSGVNVETIGSLSFAGRIGNRDSQNEMAIRSSSTERTLDFDIKNTVGVIVPGAYFESSDGLVVDTEGEEIEDAEWIIAQGPFPVSAKVEDARFSIQLLRVVYEDFLLIVDSPEANLDYAIFQATDVAAEPGNRDEIVLTFEKASPGSGISIAAGIR